MFTSNDFVDENNTFFQFSPAFLYHEESLFQFLPPPPQLMVEETTMMAEPTPSNANGKSGNNKIPRRRSGKKDRHSKIVTAQGTRDRRMRLSLEIAREFFSLQDLLGFDKASKTVEWLLRSSEEAINQISKASPAETKSAISSTSECDVVYDINEGKKVYSKGKSLHGDKNDLRLKARARARERTLEKLRRLEKPQLCPIQVGSDDLNQLKSFEKGGESISSYIVADFEEHASSKSPAHQGPNKNVAEKSSMINAVSSPAGLYGQNNSGISQGVSSNSNHNLPNLSENWSGDIGKMHSTYCHNPFIGNVQLPFSNATFFTAPDVRLQSQFLESISSMGNLGSDLDLC